MGLNWLITGGCGFIGRNLVKNLLADASHRIRIVDNLSQSTLKDLGQVCSLEDIEFIQGDILDAGLMATAAKGMDVLVHLAANTGVGPSVADPRSDCMTNVIGTFNCLEAARTNRVSRFVFASSGAPVGECDPPISETNPVRPVSPYGASKLAGEGYCSAYFRSFGLDTIALRFGNVYGEYSGHKQSVVAKFITHLMAGRPLEIYGDGSQTRDFIYVGDLVRAIRCAVAAKGVGGEIFQIAGNRETTVKEVCDLIVGHFKSLWPGCSPRVIYSEKRIGDVQRNYSDISKAERLLKWRSETRLSPGLEKTIRWFLSEG